jgi:hypothetical protein
MTTMEARVRDLERVFRAGDRVRARLMIWALDRQGDAQQVPEGSEGCVKELVPQMPFLVDVEWLIEGRPRFITSTEHLDQVDA